LTDHAFKHTFQDSPAPMNSTVAAAVPWDVVLSTFGGALATLVGVLVGGAITSRAQTRHWTLTTQAEACAGVLREYAQVSLALTQASAHPESLPEGRPLLSWAPWHQALAVLNLVADHRIVAAAHRIDAVFWELSLRVRRGELKGSEWFAARDRMEAARLDFVNTARQLLARPGPDLPRLSGRPDPSDPIWREATADQPKPIPEAPTQSQDSS
jgi:hypothetical protein